MPPYPPQVPPSNYLVLAILTTLFCFLPTGIVALIYASRVDAYVHAGAWGEAYEASRKAKNWSIITAAVGALFIIVGIILWAAVFKAASDAGVGYEI